MMVMMMPVLQKCHQDNDDDHDYFDYDNIDHDNIDHDNIGYDNIDYDAKGVRLVSRLGSTMLR